MSKVTILPRPENGCYGELLGPLRKTLQEAIDVGDDAYTEGLSYEGYGLLPKEAGLALNFEESLSPEFLTEYMQDQGQDALFRILQLAYLLGVGEGRVSVPEPYGCERCKGYAHDYSDPDRYRLVKLVCPDCPNYATTLVLEDCSKCNKED